MALTQVDSGLLNSSAQYTGFKNRIINGAMVIDQRNAGASVTQNDQGLYTLDRWSAYGTVNSKFTIQQNGGSVTRPAGFKNYLGCTSTSAYTVTATDLNIIQQDIEGYNIADLGWGTADAKTVTLSFWVRSSLTGTFGGSITGGNTRNYPWSYTISSANTWEFKTIIIAGDTSGTWGSTNGTGIIVNWSLGTGSSYSNTSGSWTASASYSVPSAVSVVGTNGATFYITGVQLEKGSTATSFDYRDYGRELTLCERYCLQFTSTTYGNPLGGIGIFLNGSTSSLFGGRFRMRSNPTATYTGAGPYMADANGSLSTVSSVSVVATGANNFVEWQFNFPVMGGGAYGGKSCYFISNVGSYLRLDAEL